MKKIDLVYLWVDGSDLKWQARKNNCHARLDRASHQSSSATSANRWRDNDELKYSLRSVEKFAPWINHIYIITDNQKPAWLAKNPKITIVDHKQIINKKFLPTFNSVAIESSIYKIPNLSEHFLYANDDMFFGRPVKPDFFFDKNGNPIVIVKRRKFPRREPRSYWRKTQWNAGRLVQAVFGLRYNVGFAHSIEPMRKSYMDDTASVVLVGSNTSRFRSMDDVQRIIFPLIDNAMGRNTLKLQRRGGFWKWILGKAEYDNYDKRWNVYNIVLKKRPATFSLNDVGKGESDKKFLEKLFPKKSVYEKDCR
ncbi:MAG: Stealth CR1 domain-containing protein [Rickettsiales bacterium]|jgi:hypothetical protein|nr:Stealth CR1 domain-containing protein [Rickettsiales bacterium]